MRRSTWANPDDAPGLTGAFFRHADVYQGDRLVRRSRPPPANPKDAVSLRLDRDILTHFRRGGRGWQSSINAALREDARLPAAKKRKKA